MFIYEPGAGGWGGGGGGGGGGQHLLRLQEGRLLLRKEVPNKRTVRLLLFD